MKLFALGAGYDPSLWSFCIQLSCILYVNVEGFSMGINEETEFHF